MTIDNFLERSQAIRLMLNIYHLLSWFAHGASTI